MKKSLSIILSLAMVCTMSATAFAADSSTDLSAIADATIQVTQTTSESGAITNTFNNLDDFVNAVHTANPAISDYEIATYNKKAAEASLQLFYSSFFILFRMKKPITVIATIAPASGQFITAPIVAPK